MTQSISATVLESLLPSNALQGKVYGVATLSVCNSRFEPDHTAEMATQVLLGTPVEILKKERGYYLVRTPDNYISWTDDAGIEAMTSEEFTEWQSADRVVYTSQYGHAFSKPSGNSSPVSDVVAGNILKVLGRKKKYYRVSYPDQRIAYIPVKDAAKYNNWVSRPNPQAFNILNTATSLIGIPYLWGGTSVKGFDCSGFTKTCYYLNGIILARDASQQVLSGEQVDIFESDTVNLTKALKNLKAGDLLFFAAGKHKVDKPRVTHTAIYMGEGKFIQAAGLVRINSLVSGDPDYDEFQTRTLVNAKRILTSIGKPAITRVDEHPFYSVRKD
nr:C40 family peptidase [Pedobacter xinjiangensis]